MTATLAVNGKAALAIHLHVPRIGPWHADCDLADEAEGLDAGDATITISDTEGNIASFKGTFEPLRNGTFGLQRKCRVVAGKAGWGTHLAAKPYHNDAQVKGSLVARDAASECGESLPDASALGPLGADYVRPAGVASRVLEDACRGVPWWVGYDGITRVGERAETPADPKKYTVITHNPRMGDVELAVDDVLAISVGSVIGTGLDAPATVTALEIAATPDSLRIHAWCGEGETSALVDTIRAIVERCTDSLLPGVWRYRVSSMSGDRVNLQRVGSKRDLPDTLATPMWPGVSGSHAVLTRGCEVLVAFIDGDRAQPAIVGFVGRGGPGNVPEKLTLGGPSGAAPVARLGDSVTVYFPPTIPFTGTVAGAPASGVLTILTPSVGIIESGSPIVEAGNGP